MSRDIRQSGYYVYSIKTTLSNNKYFIDTKALIGNVTLNEYRVTTDKGDTWDGSTTDEIFAAIKQFLAFGTRDEDCTIETQDAFNTITVDDYLTGRPLLELRKI